MSDGGATAGIVILVLALAILALELLQSIIFVQEKQAVVVERLGKFQRTLRPGPNLLMPFVDRAKRYSWRYFKADNLGKLVLVNKPNQSRISLQSNVLDFPQQAVISRDNARIELDALLNWKVAQPKTMVYSTTNLPRLLGLVLQAQLRNVAGSVDVDQLIESTTALNRVGQELRVVASRWGAHVDSVQIQRVEAGSLSSDLQKKKTADLKNKEVLIEAKRNKQTAVIKAEGQRDQIILDAEGEAQAERARARGQAKAIVNDAQATADSVREIARAIKKTTENPTRYLLALRYIKVLQEVIAQPQTEIRLLPASTAAVQIGSDLLLRDSRGV